MVVQIKTVQSISESVLKLSEPVALGSPYAHVGPRAGATGEPGPCAGPQTTGARGMGQAVGTGATCVGVVVWCGWDPGVGEPVGDTTTRRDPIGHHLGFT